MRSIMFALLLSVSFLTPVDTEARDQRGAAQTFGQLTCGKWLKWDSINNEEANQARKMWILGYMSGVNTALI